MQHIENLTGLCQLVRFFNVYGPRQNPIFLISKAIKDGMLGKNIEMYDGGYQTRCFTYVSDIIEIMIEISISQNAVGEIFNLGNNKETTVKACFRSHFKRTG